MQSQVYTQDDLKQILQKVIGQKQTLPLPPVLPPLPQAVINEEIVQVVEEVPQETFQIVEEPEEEPLVTPIEQIQPDIGLVEEIEKLTQEKEFLLQELEKAKEALCKVAKKKVPQNTQEIQAYKENINKLTLALQEAENSPREELDKAKSAIRELSTLLTETKEQLKKRDEELIRKDLSSQESHDTKQRILRLIADKKELEDKITSLSCEKATLAARLQSIQQKNLLGDEAQQMLTSRLNELTCLLEETTQTLQTTQEALLEKQTIAASHELQNQKLMQEQQLLQETNSELRQRTQHQEDELQTLKTRLESSERAHVQELSVSQACLLERSQALEEEQKKHRLLTEEHIFVKKRLEEQENHLRLLEQHLSRRVKECALLSKQLEEQMDRVATASTQLAAVEQTFAAQKEDYDRLQKAELNLRKELETQSRHYQEERHELLAQLEEKDRELADLRQLQSQFVELEHLFKKTNEILATKPEVSNYSAPAAKSQSDFFLQAQPTKATKTTFFE